MVPVGEPDAGTPPEEEEDDEEDDEEDEDEEEDELRTPGATGMAVGVRCICWWCR